MVHERCYGIIALCDREKVFLVKHKKGSYWGFPKGHVDSLEEPKEAAKRELKEETNLDVFRFLSDEVFEESYSFFRGDREIFKEVFYFVVEGGGDIKLQDKEIVDGGWFPIDDARSKITYEESRKVLDRVRRVLCF